MRRIRFLPLVLFSLCSLTRLSSQSGYVITESVRIPAESYVGDPVELRYSVRTQAELAAPEALPQADWGRFESIGVGGTPGGYDVRIVIVPYEPGTLTLPRIPLGDVQFEGLSLIVQSVLEGQEALVPIYGPQRLPGTQILLVSLVLGLAAFVALSAHVAGPGRRRILRFVERYRSGLSHRRLLRALAVLEANLTRTDPRGFYTDLVDALRYYMTGRLKVECRSATSSELMLRLPLLARRCGAAETVIAPLHDVLRVADGAKFAGAHVRPKIRSLHLEQLRRAVVTLERSRRAGRRLRKETRRVGR